MCVLGNLGCHIVTNLWVQAGDQHKGLLHDRSNLLLVSLKTNNQVLLEGSHSVGENADRVEQIADEHWLENVQLELPVHAANGGGNVVTHNLGADHGEGLALGWVDLSWHDG